MSGPAQGETAIQKINPSLLEFGLPLPLDLFDSKGRLYMRAGQVIEPADLAMAGPRLAEGLFVSDPVSGISDGGPAAAKNWRPSPIDDAVETFPVSSLHRGAALEYDLYDESGVLMLAAGARVTDRLLRVLEIRRLQHVRVRRRGLAPPGPVVRRLPESPVIRSVPAAEDLETNVTRRLDQLIEQSGVDSADRDRPFIAPRLAQNALREQYESGLEWCRRGIDYCANIANHIAHGRPASAPAAHDLVKRLLEIVMADQSLPVLLMDFRTRRGEYLHRHGLNVALLAMAVAARQGWQRHHLVNVGLGALFQDLGMLHVDESIRMAPRPLTIDERAEVERHPIYTVDALAQAGMINPISLTVAYQAHERCDSTGYPRHRHRMFIHPLARIINVADVFAAVTSPRPHRPAMLPFHGMMTVLEETKAGRLDRDATRAFLDTLSLFPVGSYVRLSDGVAARVVRSNGSAHQRPVVAPLTPGGSTTSEEIDLAQTPELTVVAALDAPDAQNRSPYRAAA